MKITREFDGKSYEIELTEQELILAYYEQQHDYDCQDVRDKIMDYNEASFMAEYGIDKADAEKYIEQFAYEMRRNIDKYDMDMFNAREEAFKEICAEIPFYADKMND